MKVVIDWYRHGLSCANVLHQRTLTGGLKQVLLHDPDLTHLGWIQAIKTGKCLGSLRKTYDFVGSSVMSRAIETAMGIWKNTKTTIHVLPHISENRHFLELDRQNAPQAHIELLKHKMKAWETSHKVSCNLDYSFLTHMTQGPSTEAFYQSVLPPILRGLIKKNPAKKTIRLALVSHGAFIRTNLDLRQLLSLEGPKIGKPIFCRGRPKAPCCQEDDGEDATTFVDPAVADPETYSVPNTAAWRETLVFTPSHRRLDRVRVHSFYAPNPRFRVFRTGRSDPLYRKDLEGCPSFVMDSVLK
jgi:broad specificity phosphatase PhoE